jgi:hypothetical protein
MNLFINFLLPSKSIMSNFILPTISNDFKTGQPFVGAIHPSLRQLNDYITRKFKNDFADENIVALTEYIAISKSSWAKGKFYLFGQLPTDLDTPLTNELLQEAIDVNIQRGIDYGGPANYLEAASIHHSEQVFQNLLHLLGRYYQHPYELMELYRPDGKFMRKFIEESCGLSSID